MKSQIVFCHFWFYVIGKSGLVAPLSSPHGNACHLATSITTGYYEHNNLVIWTVNSKWGGMWYATHPVAVWELFVPWSWQCFVLLFFVPGPCVVLCVCAHTCFVFICLFFFSIGIVLFFFAEAWFCTTKVAQPLYRSHLGKNMSLVSMKVTILVA